MPSALEAHGLVVSPLFAHLDHSLLPLRPSSNVGRVDIQSQGHLIKGSVHVGASRIARYSTFHPNPVTKILDQAWLSVPFDASSCRKVPWLRGDREGDKGSGGEKTQESKRQLPDGPSAWLSPDRRRTGPTGAALGTIAPRWTGVMSYCVTNLLRSDDTDAPYGVASGPLAAGSALMLPRIFGF